MLPGLGAYLPAPVHARRPVAGEPAAVSQTQLQIWEFVHHPAEYQRCKSKHPIGVVADGIAQAVLTGSGLHHGLVLHLMEENQCAHLLNSLPERSELRFVVGPPIHMVIDLRTLQAKIH